MKNVKPISLFNEGTDAGIVNSLDNLRPLWSKDNLAKIYFQQYNLLVRQNKIDDLEDVYKYLLEDFKEYLVN